MTDNWAAYLRRRQKWMRGSKGRPAGGSNKAAAQAQADGGRGLFGGAVGDWWDERVVSINRRWVRFQLDSAKTAGKNGRIKGKKARSEPAASKATKVSAPAPTTTPSAAPGETHSMRSETATKHASVSILSRRAGWRPSWSPKQDSREHTKEHRSQAALDASDPARPREDEEPVSGEVSWWRPFHRASNKADGAQKAESEREAL